MESYKYVTIRLLICPMEYFEIFWNMPYSLISIPCFSYIRDFEEKIVKVHRGLYCMEL